MLNGYKVYFQRLFYNERMNDRGREKSRCLILLKRAEVHGTFGTGVLSLANVSPVIIDVEAGEAFIDMGAMHARSSVEKGIKLRQTAMKCQTASRIGSYG